MSLAASALDFAHRAHRDQVRDGEMALPYLHHPLEVAHLLRWIGGVMEESQLAAAILHDTIEVGGVSQQDIVSEFGSEVAVLVVELTRTEPSENQTSGLTKPQIYSLRTSMMLQEISAMTPEAQRIKLADRLSNWREARLVKTPKKLERYRQQTNLILQTIPRTVSPPLWDTLSRECNSV